MSIDKQLEEYDRFQKGFNYRWDSGSDDAEELIKRFGQDLFDLYYNSYKVGFMSGLRAAQDIAQDYNKDWIDSQSRRRVNRSYTRL